MNDFGGSTYSPELDGTRLHQQLDRVKQFLLDAKGDWVVLQHCSAAKPGEGTAAITARARDLRKPKFGSYVVECRRQPGGRGLYEYRIPWDAEGPTRLEPLQNNHKPNTPSQRKRAAIEIRMAYDYWKAQGGSVLTALEGVLLKLEKAR